MTSEEKCPKCQHIYDISKVHIYPCNHIICLKCFRAQEKTGKICCPICSGEIKSINIEPLNTNSTADATRFHDPSLEICSICLHDHEEASYHCRSCGIFGDQSICPGCARQCHQNHCLSFSGNKSSPCVCGQCCHCNIKNIGELPNITFSCSNNNNDQVTTGVNFSCLDCSNDDNSTICPSCAKKCHSGHRLVENPIGSFICNCGLGKLNCLCQFTHKTVLKCDFDKYGSQYKHGIMYICRDCFPLDEDFSICENCAKLCHAGHHVIQKGNANFFCDCGSGECRQKTPCKFWKIPDQNDKCTFVSSNEKVNGDYYVCQTCKNKKSDGPLEMCPSCAKICHANHDLVKKNGEYICRCGESKIPYSCCHFH